MKFPFIQKILLTVVPVLALALAPMAVPAATAAGDKPVILVVGDSLSAGYGIPVASGWVALLQRRLDAQGYGYRVVNASVSGETTGGALERLPRALKLHRPAVVVIVLGGNDGLRGLPVAEVRHNLEALVRQSSTAGARVLLAGIRIPTNYGAEYSEKFYATYGDLAKKHKVALVPFFLEPIALREDLFQADGIHPGVSAQPLLLDHVWPALKKLLTRRVP
jgi:acyl-CoA thioesterase-1